MNLSVLFRSTASILILVLVPGDLAAVQKPLDTAGVHERLMKHGVGHKVCVTFYDHTEWTGALVALGEGDFTIRPTGHGIPQDAQPRTFLYDEVAAIHRPAMSTGTKIAIGVSIGVAAVAIGLGIALARWHMGPIFPQKL